MPADLLSGESVEIIAMDRVTKLYLLSHFIEALLFIPSSQDVESSVYDWIKKIWYPVLGTWLSDHSAYHTWGPWLRSPEHTYMPGRHGRLPLFLALQGGEGNPLSKLAGNTRFISELWVWLRYLHTHLQRVCVTTFSMLLFYLSNLLLSSASSFDLTHYGFYQDRFTEAMNFQYNIL